MFSSSWCFPFSLLALVASADATLPFGENGVASRQENPREWCGRNAVSLGRADCPCGARGAAPLSTGRVGGLMMMREGLSPARAKTHRRKAEGAATGARA